MKILALSDTHGNIKAIEKLVPLMAECDLIFHLGDHDRDMKPFRAQFDAKIFAVKGNCDFGGEESVFSRDGVKFMLCHGNKYHVKGSLLRLQLRAVELGVNVVFYGHTHIPDVCTYEGVTFINPGCMTKRADNTYCVVEIKDGGVASAEIKRL